MKRKVLLLIGAFVSVFTTASAWEKPAAPASQPLATDGTEQYLYNVGTGGFLLGANNWNTRASVSLTKGYRWKVEEANADLGTYTLTDYVETQSAWKRMFCDGNNSIWVDNNDGVNNDAWTITPGDGNSFSIGNNAWEGLFGANAADDYRCCFTSHSANISTEWYSVSEEAYEAYITSGAPAQLEAYNVAMELKVAIDAARAKYPNLDIAAQQAVYDNGASTVEELKAAITAVNDAVVQADKDAAKEAAIANASVENPYDMTAYIINPNFDGIKFDGWKGNGWGAGGNTAECAERYDMTFDTYQDLEDLPQGVYRILVNGFFRGNDANTPYLYGASTTDTLKVDIQARDAGGSLESLGAPDEQTIDVNGTTYYVPNSMADFVVYENAGFYNDMTVCVPVNEDGKLRIGVKKAKNSGGDWVIVDSFRLLYLGNTADAYQVIMDSQLAGLPDYSEADATESVKENYHTVVAEHSTAANMDEVRANIKAIEEAIEELKANVNAWANYKDKLEKAQETLQDPSINPYADAVLALGDYLMEAEDVLNNKELTTEEIEAELEKLEKMVQDAMQSLEAGADFTKFLKNPEMDSAAGWSGSPTINANCGEKYGSGEFDVYQIVDEDVPVGLYEISMQGFYREFRDDDANKTAWYNIFEDTEDARTFKPNRNVLAYVYMNSNKTPVNCVYDYAVEGTYDAETNTYVSNLYESGFSVDPYNKYSYPNTMANAAAAFAQGAYQVSAYGLVAKDGDKLRIGVKGNLGNTGNGWAIFDNFKLTFRAKDPTIVNKLLPDAKAALDLTDKKVGKDVRELVASTLDAVANAGTNDEKFDALAQCFDLSETIEASVKLFDKLYNAIGELETALGASEASEKTKADAGVLMDNASLGYSGEYTDAEATKAIEDIEAMIKLLSIPEFLGSDENPVNMTAFIKDASFTGLSASGNKYGAWTWTKECQNGPKFTDAFEFWNGSAEGLKFSITQEIVDLPAAKYELKAKAGNSFNGQASNEKNGRAFLFAEVAGKTAVPSVAVEPQEDNADVYSDYSVIFTVEEGDVVTIGFKTIEGYPMEARWFSGDEFELWCYGTQSAKEDTPDNIALATSIEDVNADVTVATPVAIYNAAGVKTSTLQKGLNIIRMSNGKTRKVLVR